MKIARVFVCLGVLAVTLTSAFAASHYNLNFRNPTVVAGTELKPGAYRMDLNGDKVMIQGGKQQVEASVKMEENGRKYDATSVRYSVVDGKYRVSEIWLGGTKTKVVFNN